MSRQSGRFSDLATMVEIVRGGCGFTLLIRPGAVLQRLGVPTDGRSCVVARVLGCRHLVQAIVLLIWPARRIQIVGAGVDVLHGASMVGLAILDPPHRKAASTSAAGAAAWTALAVISIRTKSPRWAKRTLDERPPPGTE